MAIAVGGADRTTAAGMRIACVHQGYELYGSDRCFVESVAAMRAAFPDAAIEVVLPRDGPIAAALAPHASTIVFEPLFVLRRKGLARLALTAPVKLPLALGRAIRRFRRADVIYVNTSVVLDYLIVARAYRGKALLHIHEIPEGVVRTILRNFAFASGAKLIFNSRATRDAFAPPSGVAHEVIYNGVAGPPRAALRRYDESRPLNLALIGRINRIKGQDVLLAALAKLPPEIRTRFCVRMVGGGFENPDAERDVAAAAERAGLRDVVSVEPFAADVAPVYRWADVVVVPSKRPESLGRTAIEAMAYGRPALVSAIGGLTEVVADGETGWHVPPGDEAALAARLAEIVARPDRWAGFGLAARARYERLFSPSATASAIAAAVASRSAASQRSAEPRRPEFAAKSP